MAKENFADKLIEAVKKKGTPICVGLDPRLDQIPEAIVNRALAKGDKTPMAAAADAIIEFNKGIIDAVADLVPVVKPQIAFYEIYGSEGVRAYEETLKYAKSKGLLTIADAKSIATSKQHALTVFIDAGSWLHVILSDAQRCS